MSLLADKHAADILSVRTLVAALVVALQVG